MNKINTLSFVESLIISIIYIITFKGSLIEYIVDGISIFIISYVGHKAMFERIFKKEEKT